MAWLTHASEKPFAFVVDFMPAHFANSGLLVLDSEGTIKSGKKRIVSYSEAGTLS
jgi:hypothetical protein